MLIFKNHIFFLKRFRFKKNIEMFENKILPPNRHVLVPFLLGKKHNIHRIYTVHVKGILLENDQVHSFNPKIHCYGTTRWQRFFCVWVFFKMDQQGNPALNANISRLSGFVWKIWSKTPFKINHFQKRWKNEKNVHIDSWVVSCSKHYDFCLIFMKIIRIWGPILFVNSRFSLFARNIEDQYYS